MTTVNIKILWPHEAIRARPGMYLEGASDPCSQAEVLLKLTVESMAITGNGAERLPVVLRLWPGPAFEMTCPWQCSSSEFLGRGRSTLSSIEWRMLNLFAGGPRTWEFLDGHGILLSALSSRVLLQVSNGERCCESAYSRGGLISPLQDSRTGPSNGSRVVFELDRLFFDDAARAHVHSDEVLDALAARFSWLTIAQRAADVRAGDPWSP
ncbi:hypothetical protein K8640_14720 [Myxococcus sp. XM-1-1-1]|uniref:hypothetical protein n=1 Tax=Myxococcus sp. XM-1-1-1 TaxID=2874602 RepID=UPI001CBCA720|nr:hypothetical protein [Myxococcus sp. XM-1-1-1]MBZ4409474.1 hypothetical protein [Myxococcus sp. XM-1-1-1]